MFNFVLIPQNCVVWSLIRDRLLSSYGVIDLDGDECIIMGN